MSNFPNTNHYVLFNKIVDIIQSCVTSEHSTVASKVVIQAQRLELLPVDQLKLLHDVLISHITKLSTEDIHD